MPAAGKEIIVETETLPAGSKVTTYKPRLNHTKTIKSGKLP